MSTAACHNPTASPACCSDTRRVTILSSRRSLLPSCTTQSHVRVCQHVSHADISTVSRAQKQQHTSNTLSNSSKTNIKGRSRVLTVCCFYQGNVHSSSTTNSSSSNSKDAGSASDAQQQPHASQPALHELDRNPGCSSSSSSSSNSSSSSSSSGSASCRSHFSSLSEDSADSPMVLFLTAYGLQPSDINRVMQECPQLFVNSTTCSSSSSSSSLGGAVGAAGGCTAGWSPFSYEEEAATQAAAAADGFASVSPTCVYEVGRTLLFFHDLGWSHASVMRRIVGLYPQILTKQVERDMLPVLSALSGMGCSPSDLQLLVWEFPRIFTSSNWRRHVRKFQYLGLYGLPPPGHSRTGSSKESSTSSSAGSGTSSGVGSSTGSVWEHSTDSSTDSLDRLMRWI